MRQRRLATEVIPVGDLPAAKSIDFVAARPVRGMLHLRCIRDESARIRNARVIAGVLTSIAVLVAGSIRDVRGQPVAFSIKDTGHDFATLHSVMRQIFWLDNGRILYNGYEPHIREIRKSDGRSVPKLGIYILDVRSNQLTRHADADGFLCYRSGFIRYLVSYDVQSRVAVRREGRFREEREIVIDMREQPRGHLLNELTCQYYDATGHATETGRRLPLLDKHGVLEYARQEPVAGSAMYPARLYVGSGKTPITLRVNGAAVSASRVRYYEFANAYTVGYLPPQGPATQWPKDAVHHVFLMSPEGKVTDVPISGGAWSDVTVSTFVLTRAGVVLYGGKLRRHLDPGTTGIYLVQGNRSQKLASGLLHGIGVSPDGCRVAVAMQTYAKTPDPTLVRIVDFCGKEGSK